MKLRFLRSRKGGIEMQFKSSFGKAFAFRGEKRFAILNYADKDAEVFQLMR